MARLVIIFSLFGLFLQPLQATNPPVRRTQAERIQEQVRIDGVMDEAAWQSGAVATDFTQYEPVSGGKSSQHTEVRIVYDDKAIYIGADMHDTAADSIMRQLSRRDAGLEANADLFAIAFDTYQDHQNAFWFSVSAAGVQSDSRFSALGEDAVWDAVWKSAVVVHDKGWTVEMEIPYSALRFSGKDIQDWGMQMRRVVRRSRQTDTWSPMDRRVEGVVNQFGVLEGLKGLKPPVRLALTPYVSSYLEKNSANGLSNPYRSYFSAGADLKLGLSESFTLDMTLVPDFGQVVADNQVLNLSPFEVQFKENRQFFTEGTELFNIANVFYSRRIGGTPRMYGTAFDSLRPGESLISNPNKTRLLNAFKLSGRTSGKTGIGVFNAMTAPSFAEAELDGSTREIMTQAFTNYNVAVVDQNFSNNSFASLINTNRLEINGYIDNVTAARLRLADQKNTYFVASSGALSQLFRPGESSPELGGAFNYRAGKGSGNLTFEVGQNIETDTYNPTGMGYLQSNNEFSDFGKIRYRHMKKLWKFVTIGNTLSFTRTSLFRPYRQSNLDLNYESWFQTEQFDFFGIWGWVNPKGGYDFFEPRVMGRQLAYQGGGGVGGFVSTNYARRFALDINFDYWGRPEMDLRAINYTIQPRVRLGDRFSMNHTFRHNMSFNEFGFVDFDSTGQSLIGIRDRRDLENILGMEYSFTNKMALTFRGRHIWSGVKYNQITQLQDDGSMLPISDQENHDINFNVFSIDAVFQWRYAPGSDLFVVWKTNILNWGDLPEYNYLTNLRNTFDSPQVNSISVRWLYYLDLGRHLRRQKPIQE